MFRCKATAKFEFPRDNVQFKLNYTVLFRALSTYLYIFLDILYIIFSCTLFAEYFTKYIYLQIYISSIIYFLSEDFSPRENKYISMSNIKCISNV